MQNYLDFFLTVVDLVLRSSFHDDGT